MSFDGRVICIKDRVLKAGIAILLSIFPLNGAFAQTNAEMMHMIELLQQQILELKDKVRKNEAAAKEAAEGTMELPPQVARSGKKEIELKVSGQVNRAALIYDDGDRGDVLFVDNDNSSTRLKFQGKGKINDTWIAGANFTVQLESNSTQNVNQQAEQNQSPNNFTQHKLEVWVDHKKLGRIWLGQGSEAVDGIAEKDLSGTSLAGHSDIDDNAGGLNFANDGNLSGIRIRDVFTNLDGGRDDRIRYDTPMIAGIKLSAAAIADSEYDVAGTFENSFGDLKAKAGIGYAWENTDSKIEKFLGSASVLHKSTGLSISVAVGLEDDTNSSDSARDDENYIYGKLGYQANFFTIGKTAFSIDYYDGDNIRVNDDDSDAYGFQLVQKIDPVAMELYLGLRNHEYDAPGADVDDIFTALTGARIKF